MSYDEEHETFAAHVYRNGKILCTILIEPVDDGNFWHIYREGRGVLATASSFEEAQELADIYLAAYMAGLDKALEDIHARKEST